MSPCCPMSPWCPMSACCPMSPWCPMSPCCARCLPAARDVSLLRPMCLCCARCVSAAPDVSLLCDVSLLPFRVYLPTSKQMCRTSVIYSSLCSSLK
ncbi:hypothetical protein GDO81_025175 [Engystomops pustulosus]|uniref:Secreted protein n=1 Tax=Engystomops pustulosus TaxID=76066 RepID=A0AAV6YIL5_ENGPU|nr:hypothetical protein GDO81_025175 [Engystomops pustulosus]